MSKEYEKANIAYQEAAAKAKKGDTGAMAEKARIAGEMRQMERASAKGGTILNAVVQNGKVIVSEEKTDSKRSLQEEYVRRFDDNKPVQIHGDSTTLREFHAHRLLGK